MEKGGENNSLLDADLRLVLFKFLHSLLKELLVLESLLSISLSISASDEMVSELLS